MPKKAAAPPATWEHRITGHADVDPRTLTPHPDNYREDDTVQDAALVGSVRTLGWLKSIIVNTTTGHVLDGHERIEQAIAHDQPTVPVEYVTIPEVQEAQALVSLDPIGAMKRANRERLAYLMDQVQSDDSAVQEMLRGLREQHGLGDVGNVLPSDEGLDENYSRKIEPPIYEPKGPKPALADLYDRQRTHELLMEIDASTLPEEEKVFLRLAAQRHTVFNYKLIAEYYAHSDAATQRLMENSALVIIDFDRAIELGYVKLSEAIAAQYREEYGDDAD